MKPGNVLAYFWSLAAGTVTREATAAAAEWSQKKGLTRIPLGFVPWHGGENPVPGRLVVFVSDDGAMWSPIRSNFLVWRHDTLGIKIIAYKVVRHD